MADYAKKKNDELQALCKERGLAHTGKKADLVKRLEDHDAQDPSSTAAPPAAVKPTEDEIDWDDEPAIVTAKGATSEAAANAIAAGGVGEVANPLAVPNQVQVEDPTQSNDLTVVPPEGQTEAAQPAAKEASPEKDFSSGLAERTLDEEIEKRKARAKRFGLPEDSEEIKALERAKRFGNGADVLKGLNAGMTTEARKRGRGGREGGALPAGMDRALGDAGVRKAGGRGRGGRQGNERRDRERASPAPGSGVQKGSGNWMSAADKEAVEKRKARFAKAS